MSIIDSFPKKGKQQNNLIQYTPIGTIIAVMGTSVPNNYLICDGSVYNIVDYPELANYFQTQFGSKNYFGGDNNVTFAVPDLRGEFLRGSGTNSHANQGNGSSVGTHQDNGLPNITGTLLTYVDIGRGSSGVFKRVDDGTEYPGTGWAVGERYNRLDFSASWSNSIYGSASEARPTNTSVLYCIAYKDYVALGISSSDEEETTSGHIISSNGTELEEQPVLNFTDFDISNDTDNNETDIKQHRLTQEELNEIASELPDVIDNKNKIKYSLEEQVVGEWIDGKPIYQKVLTGYNEKMNWIGTHAYSGCDISVPIQNVKSIINARIFMSNASNGDINWFQICNIYVSNTTWKICALEDYYFRTLIVQYTKTTD